MALRLTGYIIFAIRHQWCATTCSTPIVLTLNKYRTRTLLLRFKKRVEQIAPHKEHARSRVVCRDRCCGSSCSTHTALLQVLITSGEQIVPRRLRVVLLAQYVQKNTVCGEQNVPHTLRFTIISAPYSVKYRGYGTKCSPPSIGAYY